MTEITTDKTSLSKKLFSLQKFVSLKKQSLKGLRVKKGMQNVDFWLKPDVWLL